MRYGRRRRYWSRIGSASARRWFASRDSLICRSRRKRLFRTLIAEFPIQPCLGEIPIPNDSEGGKVKNFGGFFYTEPAEESQLDDPAPALIELCEICQRLVERDKIPPPLGRP